MEWAFSVVVWAFDLGEYPLLLILYFGRLVASGWDGMGCKG